MQTRWKETLLRIVQEEEETITPDNKQLLEDMEEVRRLLRDDDSQRDEVRAYRKDKVFARLNVEKKIEDLRKFIVEELHCTLTPHTHAHARTQHTHTQLTTRHDTTHAVNENKRLRDLLMDLKDANRRLQASTFRSVMHQTFYISREQRARIAKVVGLMIQHFRVLFKVLPPPPPLRALLGECALTRTTHVTHTTRTTHDTHRSTRRAR